MTMSKRVLIVFPAFVFLLFFSCAPKPATAPAIPGEQPGRKEAAIMEGWETEWKKVQQEARKEGKLVLYTGVGTEMRNAFAQALTEYGIELESLSGRGGEMVEKILRERRSGIYSADFYISGSSTIVLQMKPAGLLAPLEPLFILPEVKDPKMWYKGVLPFADKDKLVLGYSAYPSGELHINTEQVKPGEIKTLRDLLSPRWKEKIIMDDPTVPGRGNQWLATITIKMGEDYVKQLADQKPVISRDKRQQIDWLAKGRAPVGIGLYPDQYREYKDAGAPVFNLILNEALYLTAGFGYVTHFDRASHPNASRVFLNWLLSKKGQTLWDSMMDSQSARIDTPVEPLIKRGLMVRQPGIDYIDTTSDMWVLEEKPKAEKIFMESFKALLK